MGDLPHLKDGRREFNIKMKLTLEIFVGIFGLALLFALFAGILNLFTAIGKGIPFQITSATAGIVIFIGGLIPVIVGGLLIVSYGGYLLWQHLLKK